MAPLDAYGHSVAPTPRCQLDPGGAEGAEAPAFPDHPDTEQILNPVDDLLRSWDEVLTSWLSALCSHDPVTGPLSCVVVAGDDALSVIPASLFGGSEKAGKLTAPVGNLSLVDEPRKHPCCGRQLDPSLMGCKSGDFSSNLHQAGWGYNSCTGGAVDEADADADVASVCCWLYGVFFITFDNAADAAHTNVMQEGLLNFGILLKAFWMMILRCCNGNNDFGGALCLELVRAAVEMDLAVC
ncbi:hypothetical protein Nepgr_033075 [Nepenthes gracilis]|uniref:Uncharacterized protein n=1 Tax=Nepenthes gracilis TaxID=150966 RepID=A0AAD3TM18_NEPGR|nr:hypothetical protein Nepgr_033075 [Nepenthes gracilis]